MLDSKLITKREPKKGYMDCDSFLRWSITPTVVHFICDSNKLSHYQQTTVPVQQIQNPIFEIVVSFKLTSMRFIWASSETSLAYLIHTSTLHLALRRKGIRFRSRTLHKLSFIYGDHLFSIGYTTRKVNFSPPSIAGSMHYSCRWLPLSSTSSNLEIIDVFVWHKAPDFQHFLSLVFFILFFFNS